MIDGEALDTSSFVSSEQGVEESAALNGVPAPAEPPADTPPAEEAPAEAPGEQEGGEEGQEGQEPPKPKKTAQERIDEITAARRTAEREAKYWRDVAEGKVRPQAEQDREPAEAKAPNPQDYDFGETDPKYIEAVIDYRVEKGLDKVRASVAQDLHSQAGDRAWEARQDAARSKFADYDAVTLTHDPVTGAPRWACSQAMAQAIRTSDVGGEIAYHLASNPEEARRISALDPFSQVRALGKLEATLEQSAAPQPKPKTSTDAPKPPTSQARGAGGQFSVAPDTDDFAAFDKAFTPGFTAN